jgi:transglutaminase-like putative cysteine protease
VLAATPYIDSDHPAVIAFAREAIGDATGARERASRLFAAVRERLRYDPYTITAAPSEYRASTLLMRDRAYCIPKAVLLCAAARAAGIPAWVGFADVKNHLTSEKLQQKLNGRDLYIWHGYTALEIEGKVVKATPAFNAALCARFGVPALDFDGVHDALLQPFDGQGRMYMEYVADRGLFDELPLARILDDFRSFYALTDLHDEPGEPIEPGKRERDDAFG